MSSSHVTTALEMGGGERKTASGVLAASDVSVEAGVGGDRAPSSAAAVRVVAKLPRAVRNQQYCIKFVYLVIYCLLLWLLYSLPSTALWDRHGELETEYFSLLVFASFISYLSFLFVQASNPGYIHIEGDGEVADSSVEMSSLLNSHRADADHQGEAERKPIPVSSGLIPHDMEQGGRDAPPSSPRASSGTQHSVAPLRSKYCRACRMRVCTFDHHCHVLGTCIGERNHARFWWFLFLLSVNICIAIVVVDSGYVYERYWLDWIAANELAFLASIIFYLLLLFVGGLFIFHTWLACSSLTTYEMGRGSKLEYLRGTRDFDLPFSNGLIGNLRSFCCLRDPLCSYGRSWKPIGWKQPGAIDRESEDVWENCWENKYWSCC